MKTPPNTVGSTPKTVVKSISSKSHLTPARRSNSATCIKTPNTARPQKTLSATRQTQSSQALIKAPKNVNKVGGSRAVQFEAGIRKNGSKANDSLGNKASQTSQGNFANRGEYKKKTENKSSISLLRQKHFEYYVL